MFSRSQVLGGLSARRAGAVAYAIEARTAGLVRLANRALVATPARMDATGAEVSLVGAMAEGRSGVTVGPRDLERYAADWADLVPADPGIRAGTISILGAKHLLDASRMPRLRAALGADDPEVLAAFERTEGRSVTTAFRASPDARERLRWRRARIAERLETLPPAAVAFALVLTETIAEGILAIPIAVARMGVAGGLGVVLLLGLLNIVTLVALVEAMTRTGAVRDSGAYLGRLVGEHLGPLAAGGYTLVLFAFNALVLLTYLLGFGSVLSDATGVPIAWCAAGLVGVDLAYLARARLDATVASAMVVGAINLVLLGAIMVIGLAHLDPVLLAAGPTATDLSELLALAFGVVMVAYVGHMAAANGAQLVLVRDPSGRSLLTGSVAAMAVVIGLYGVTVIAFGGAVPAERMAGVEGTAFGPLAEVAGPIVHLLGALYGVAAIGLGSVFVALSLSNQVREWLPRPDIDRTRHPGSLKARILRLTSSARGSVIAGMVPIVAVLIVLELLLLTGSASFAALLSITGVLAVPVLVGVVPMLLVVATRRRGELVPDRVVGLVGRPAVAGVVVLLFLAGLAAHALVIWTAPLERLAAAAVLVGLSLLCVGAWRRGSYRPRWVLELRVEEGRAAITSVLAGRPAPLALAWSGTPSGSATADLVALGPSGALRELSATLPAGHPTDLRVRSQRIEGGLGTPWPVSVSASVTGVVTTAAVAAGAQLVQGDHLDLHVPPGDTRVTIHPQPTNDPR